MELHVTGDTTNLLKPTQVAEAKEELAGIEATLNAPPHIRSRISDPRQMQKRRQALRGELEQYTPRAYSKSELDAAIKEFNGLADFIREGMPSSVTMRRNPPGAVGSQISWEKRTEKAVLRYKHIALRLLATGAVPDNLKHGNDIGSVERLRPLEDSTDPSMEGAQIPKTTDYHFGADVANSVLFNDAEIAAANELDPEIAGALAIMDSDQRAILKKHIQELLNQPGAEPTNAERMASWNNITRAASKAGIKTFGRKREEVLADLTAAGISV
jgi:hypothetical protein